MTLEERKKRAAFVKKLRDPPLLIGAHGRAAAVRFGCTEACYEGCDRVGCEWRKEELLQKNTMHQSLMNCIAREHFSASYGS